MITALALNAGGSALLGGAVGIAWRRRRQRRTEDLRARYEDAYDPLVARYGRLRAERLMKRSLDRFERHVRLLLLPGVSDPTSPSPAAR